MTHKGSFLILCFYYRFYKLKRLQYFCVENFYSVQINSKYYEINVLLISILKIQANENLKNLNSRSLLN